MPEFGIVLIVAFLLDVLVGDPDSEFHPVCILGHIIDGGEYTLRSVGLSGFVGGFLLVGLLSISWVGGYIFVYLYGITGYSIGITAAVNGFFLYLCIAFRSSLDHAVPIIEALREEDIEEVREAVGKIVGRETGTMDEPALGRATVESITEGFVDGLTGPLFWYVVGAGAGLMMPGWDPVLPGVGAALFYRCMNTMDAMIGYRNERYMQFGRVAARMDDLVNIIPSRISVFFLFMGAMMTGGNLRAGLRAWFRDRNRHPSPNAGQTESLMAGLLEVKLGGPAVYPHGMEERPWMGEGTANVSIIHIKQCVKIVLAGGIMAYMIAFFTCIFLQYGLLPLISA